LNAKTVPESKASVNLDPFGIDEVASAKNSTLVQGCYRIPEESSNETKTSRGKAESPIYSQSSNRLQVYDTWIKHREEVNGQARLEAVGGEEADHVRETHYGKVRLDSDKVNKKKNSQDPVGKMSSKRQTRYDKSVEEKSMSEKDVITAEEFLRSFKDHAREEDTNYLQKQKTNEVKIPSPIIHDPVPQRRLVHRVSQADLDAQKFKESIIDDTVGSRVLPKPYQFPDFNKMTSQEIWYMLRKSIVFQNDFLLAINKPYGIPIHSPGVDCRHFVIEYLDRLAEFGQCEKLYPLHRLDKETSGVLLFAKEPKVAKVILEKFAQRSIEKTYLAVVKLCPSIPEGTIKIPIGEGKVGGTEKYRMVLKPDLVKYEIKSNQGQCREAVTHFKVIKSTQYASFLKVIPESGVKHQIRLHLGLGLGCPIVGDQKYSHRDRMAPQRLHPYLLNRIKVKQSKVRLLPLHLHCNSIRFSLPEEFTKSVEPIYVHAKVPYYFYHTLRAFGLSR